MSYVIEMNDQINFVGKYKGYSLQHLYQSPLYRVSTGLGTPDLMVAAGDGTTPWLLYWDGASPILTGVPWVPRDPAPVGFLARAVDREGDPVVWSESLLKFNIILYRLSERVIADGPWANAMRYKVDEIRLGNEDVFVIGEQEFQVPRLYTHGGQLTLMSPQETNSDTNNVFTFYAGDSIESIHKYLMEELSRHLAATNDELEQITKAYLGRLTRVLVTYAPHPRFAPPLFTEDTL